jgi:hypothetical protein
MSDQNNKSVEEYIDIEEYAKAGKKPPKGKKYLIRVDRANYKVDQSSLTGREILELAGKTPVQKYQLNQKVQGGAVKKIEYDEKVDFTTPGIERFMTIPLDQTEG